MLNALQSPPAQVYKMFPIVRTDSSDIKLQASQGLPRFCAFGAVYTMSVDITNHFNKDRYII